MSERNRAAIFTQHEVKYHQAGNPVIDKVNRYVRKQTFNSSPHLGAGLLASQLREIGYSASYFPLEKLNSDKLLELSDHHSKLLFSVIDLQTDAVRELLLKNPDMQGKSVVGGQGVTPSVAKELSDQLPEVSIVVGRAENVLAVALNNPGIHQGEFYDLGKFSSHPAMDEKYTFRGDPWFSKSKLKLVETSTGCTQRCDFCPIPGERVTHKDLDTVFKEVEMSNMKRTDILLIVDHNIFNADQGKLMELFRSINEKKIYWAGEGTIYQAINNPDLLREMGKNCISMLCGLENVAGNIGGSPVKSKMVENFGETLGKIRDARLPVTWSLVFPLEDQTPESYTETASFIKEHKINVNLHLIQPRSGSGFLEQLVKEDRLVESDSRCRDGSTLVYEPKGMSREQALAGYVWLLNKVVSMTPDRLKNNLRYGVRYAAALAALDVTAVGMPGVRLKSLYPELSEEISHYEELWRKLGK